MEKEPVIQTYYKNHLPRERWGKVIDQPSATIPGQSLTVQQLRDRFTNGRGATGVRAPLYLGEGEHISSEEFHQMDLADQEAMIEANNQLVNELKADLEKQQKAYGEKKRQQQMEAAVEVRYRQELRDQGLSTSEIRDQMKAWRENRSTKEKKS